mmetsp:Transcript_72571/g.200171  ORF Transcript_72571/g.200171 Transcript_72571/m.200171 type:complete len:136 (+) Transcript_72571:43-450(+)
MTHSGWRDAGHDITERAESWFTQAVPVSQMMPTAEHRQGDVERHQDMRRRPSTSSFKTATRWEAVSWHTSLRHAFTLTLKSRVPSLAKPRQRHTIRALEGNGSCPKRGESVPAGGWAVSINFCPELSEAQGCWIP